MSEAAGDTPSPASFAEALAAMTDDALAALLRQRPDAAVPPPADFDVLASRLSSQHSVSRAAETVDQFVLDVLEALVLGRADEDELAYFCQVPAADIKRVTDIALKLGLAWRDGDGRLNVAKGVRSAVGDYPLGLGRPFARLIAEVPQNVRVQMRQDLGLPEERTATAVLTEYFADQEAVIVLLDELSEGQRAILTQLASGPPVGEVEGQLRYVSLEEAETGIERLLARGLLIAVASDAVELPREVGLALRGSHPAGAVSPHPPAVAGRAVPAKDVDAGGAATALDALRLFEVFIDRWDENPPTLTRAGGLPVRELRGAAKALGVEQAVIALIVQTASAASLIGRTAGVDPVMVPTERYDRWRDAPMAERWALLATAWCGMDQLPGLAVHEDGTKAGALLTYDVVRPGAGELRRDVLGALAAAGKGHAPDLDLLPAWLRWRVPTRSGHYIEQVCAWTLAEAQFLGVTGRGALTAAGRCLLDSPNAVAARSGDDVAARAYREDVAEVLAPSLPKPIEHVLIQADLTAVAPGPLVPHIARELALLADVESAGAATVYRFSDASLRRAFDAGRSATDLHQLINDLARGPVPQALTYLIDDIARRHGRLRAGTAAGYLRSDDPALLAEVVANRRTASAGLVLVAPTVAVSPLEPAQILAVLRTAGYAPAGDTATRGGGITLDQAAGRRVPVAAARTSSGAWSAGATLPESHVTQTIAMLRRVAALRRPGRRPAVAEPDAEQTVDTPEAISNLLREAAADSSAVWISYVNAEGRHSRRTVYPTLVSGGFVIGLDDETGERRTFAISRIQEAAPA
jgi:hypothetical protein